MSFSKPKFDTHPQSVPGDFYAVRGECLACGVPHTVAPELFGWTEDGWHCFWKKQPETPEEMDHAIQVLHIQEAKCHRYAGSNRKILDCLPPDCCDYRAAAKSLAAIPPATPPSMPPYNEARGLAYLWRKLTRRR